MSLKWFLELLQSHFAYILSVNVSEIHKNRPVSQNTWNTVYGQPETFYILQYVLFILQRVLIVPYTTHIGSTELFPSAFTAMSFTNDIVSGILFFKHVFQPRHGVSVELQQNLWKIGTKLYWGMLSPPALYLAQIIFLGITTDSCFQDRQSRNSIHSLSLPSHSPPALLIGEIAAMRNSLSLTSCPL